MTRATPIPETVTLHVPFRVVKRGGRKEMQLPEGAAQPRRTDNTLVKALARAFRWKRMLESGEFATIAELAEREGIASSYMTRVLRLTLLAPGIVEAILDGRQGPEVTLARMLEPFPEEWCEQHGTLASTSRAARNGPSYSSQRMAASSQAGGTIEPMDRENYASRHHAKSGLTTHPDFADRAQASATASAARPSLAVAEGDRPSVTAAWNSSSAL